MKIEIDEPEIKDAIIDYVCKKGFNINYAQAIVDIKNARGEFGVSAAISIDPQFADKPVKEEAAKIDIPPQTPKEAIVEPKDGKKLKFGNE